MSTTTTNDQRKLGDLVSVGPATIRDLKLLGVTSVERLVDRDASDMLRELRDITGQRHDPCCEDVFACAIAQARNPKLPREQLNWWWWSNVRKQRGVETIKVVRDDPSRLAGERTAIEHPAAGAGGGVYN